MEKAILKTLIYADIFDYPLKAWEIHKWLIGKKSTLFQVEKALAGKKIGKKIKAKAGYYFLNRRVGTVSKRISRAKSSKRHLIQVKWVAQTLKIVPWVKLVGVSGSLAMDNSDGSSDIDLFVITQKNRLWLSRIFLLAIFGFLGKRRKREEDETESAGKFCLNLLMDEDHLGISKGDIYLSHEILQMRVIWQRDEIYSKFLEENSWVFKFLPNWTSNVRQNLGKKIRSRKVISQNELINLLEEVIRWLQLRYMGEIKGQEIISKGVVFFHPKNKNEYVINKYKQVVSRLI